MAWWGIIFIGAGFYAILGAIMDWDFFMEHSQAVLFVKILGRNGARVFYVQLGTAIIFGGLFCLANPESFWGN